MTTYYRNVVQVEILSDVPLAGSQLTDLSTVHYLITEGGYSGEVTVQATQQVDAVTMTGLLQAQGSDPDFLLAGDPDWEDSP